MSDPFQPHGLAACQVPLSMGLPRLEYWSELPFPSPGDLPDPGIKPESPALAGGFFTTEPPRKPWQKPENQKRWHLDRRKGRWQDTSKMPHGYHHGRAEILRERASRQTLELASSTTGERRCCDKGMLLESSFIFPTLLCVMAWGHHGQGEGPGKITSLQSEMFPLSYMSYVDKYKLNYLKISHLKHPRSETLMA